MNKPRYIQNIVNDPKNIIKPMCCINCGLIPSFNKKLLHNGVSTTIDYKDWVILDNKDKICPLCMRKIKIDILKDKVLNINKI